MVVPAVYQKQFFLNKYLPLQAGPFKMLPGSTFKVTPNEARLISEGSRIKPDFSYTLNSCSQRCDEFSKQHNGKHILFSGCSFTFGEGLPYMENWSGRLYKKISESESLSGYYSIAYCGGSIDYIVQNTFKYFEEFGQPQVIFALFPDSRRILTKINNQEIILMPINQDDVEKVWEDRSPIIEQSKNIELLIEYCKQNNILFLWSSWDQNDIKHYRSRFLVSDGFIDINDLAIAKNAEKKNSNNKKYYDTARDGRHPGIRYNSGIANIFYQGYIKKN